MKTPKKFVGDWRITETELWDEDALDLVVPAHITVDDREDPEESDRGAAGRAPKEQAPPQCSSGRRLQRARRRFGGRTRGFG